MTKVKNAAVKGGGSAINASKGARPLSITIEMAPALAYITMPKSIENGASVTYMMGQMSVRNSSMAAQKAASGHG